MAALAGLIGRSRKGDGRVTRPAQPLEYSILLTVTLCLLAYGAVMVYSASSARSLLSGEGDGSAYLIKYLIYAAVGLVAMNAVARTGLRAVWKVTPLLVAISFVLLAAVLIPGLGVTVNGANRWIGPGFLQFQPSELAKLALVLYSARLIATDPQRMRTLKGMISPLLVIAGLMAGLVAIEPDLGTALVIAATSCALLVAAGVPLRNIAIIAGVGIVLVTLYALLEPYRRARLTAFLNPWADAGDTGFQAVQGQIAIGSGGLFGVGLGQSVQKIFYLPEAHTDFILAVIGEELGVVGVSLLLFLYGVLAYVGLRTAATARSLYAKLLAAGVTSLIICQALLNVFAVLGIAPLTGVPLPFISYGGSSLIVKLVSVGLLLNIANSGAAAHLSSIRSRVTESFGSPISENLRNGKTASRGSGSGRRYRRARDPGTHRRRRAAG